MSGLLYRYMVLLAAVAMTGVTAFPVTPGSVVPAEAEPPSAGGMTSISRPFAAAGPPSVAGDPVDDLVLGEGREFAAVTRVVEPDSKTATIVFGGDILVHNGVSQSASLGGTDYDFRPMLADLSSVVSPADLAICHLEVPLSSTNSDLSSYPRFNAPYQVAEGIASAGFDGCSTASNHSADKGEKGLIDTLEILDDAGLGHAGTARSQEEAASATIYELGDLTVAHIAGTYWLNGRPTPAGKDWMAQRLDIGQMLEMAKRARRAGADLVVVSVHCCTEYRTEPTEAQVEIFRELIESPWVDLVVGHHSHVVGPVDRIGGEFVVYGLGNLLSGQLQTSATSDGVLAVATAEWADGGWSFVDLAAVPTVVEPGTYHVKVAAFDSSSFQRTMSVLGSYGTAVEAYEVPAAP